MKKLALLLLLIALSYLTLRAFFVSPDFVDVHDPTAIYRISTMVDSLSEKQFPAAWHNTLNYGFGYPLHLYYAQLFTLIGVILSKIGLDYVLAAKLTLLLLTVVSASGAYLLMVRYGRVVGAVTAVAYTFLPYHASALYVRGSYAEFAAISIMPWVIYFWSTQINSKRRLLGATVTTSLFLISHNTLPYLLLPVIAIYIWRFQSHQLKNVTLALVLAFALAATFTAPSLFERGYVQVEDIATQTKVSDHFVAINQMWYSPWDYGGSVKGEDDRMSLMLGKGQLILAFLGFIALALTKNYQLLSLTIPILAYLFLALESSTFIWELLPKLALIQFPWRVYGIATLALSMLAGYSLYLLPFKFHKLVGIIIITLLINTNAHYFKPWGYLSYTPEILSSHDNLYPLVQNKIPEYLPVWMKSFATVEPSDGLTRNITQVIGTQTLLERGPIKIDTAYMPHWQLTVNQSKVQITPDDQGRIRSVNEFEPGNYWLQLDWHKTQVEVIASYLSLLALIAVIGLAL